MSKLMGQTPRIGARVSTSLPYLRSGNIETPHNSIRGVVGIRSDQDGHLYWLAFGDLSMEYL